MSNISWGRKLFQQATLMPFEQELSTWNNFQDSLFIVWVSNPWQIDFDVHFDEIQRDVLLSKFHNLEPYVMFQVFHSTSWTSLKSQLRTLFIPKMAVVGTPQNSFQKCCKNILKSTYIWFLPLRFKAPSGLDNCTTFSLIKNFF